MVYGCGTIANFLIGSNLLLNYDICSGLKEEIGKNFYEKKKIENVNILNFDKYDLIIISSIGYETQIINSYFKNIISDEKLHILKKYNINNKIKYT